MDHICLPIQHLGIVFFIIQFSCLLDLLTPMYNLHDVQNHLLKLF